MSRTIGKAYDVYNISCVLRDSPIENYHHDRSKLTWKEIESVPEKIEIYLPKETVDFLLEEKVKLYRRPFKKYTDFQIPDPLDKRRGVFFPSKKPYKEFARELAFYLGVLFSTYSPNKEADAFSNPREYNDILPLLMEYLYAKETDDVETFIRRHLGFLKSYTKTFIPDYEQYKGFEELMSPGRMIDLSEEEYEDVMKGQEANEIMIEEATGDTVLELSSFDGVLQLIDRNYSVEDMKELIRTLFENKDNDRSQILRSVDVDSYGYKRLRKEIDNYVAKK